MKKTLGPYEIRQKIGQGGMGIVYRAYEANLDREVAIKVLPRDVSSNEKFIERFLRESRAAAKIEHPHIVSIFGAGKDKGDYYLAMQLIQGKPLSSIVKEEGILPWETALEIVRQTASALAVAHEKGIIHRDIKPDNIMLDDTGNVKVMDFGLAKGAVFDSKITESGVYLGTPEYSSPEQCETLEVDGRADIYSLGVVLYEMLAGSVPHTAETPLSLFKKIVYDKPRPVEELNPLVPKTVVSLLRKMMAKKPEKRYEDAPALLGDIDMILGKSRDTGLDRLVTGGVPTTAVTVKKISYRSRGRLATFAIGGAAVAVALVVTLALALGTAGNKKGNGLIVIPTDASSLLPVKPLAYPTGEEPVEKNLVCVVLDFQNRQNNEDLAWMQVGVADMLITDLAQLPWLRVFDRGKIQESLETVRAEGVPSHGAASRLADKLEASILVRGSYILIKGKVKIDVNVVAHPSGRVILSHPEMDVEANLLELVDRISSRIREKLAAKFRRSREGMAPEASVERRGRASLAQTLTSTNRGSVADGLEPLAKPQDTARLVRSLDQNLAIVIKFENQQVTKEKLAQLKAVLKKLGKDSHVEDKLRVAKKSKGKDTSSGPAESAPRRSLSGKRRAGRPAAPAARADDKKAPASKPRKASDEPAPAPAPTPAPTAAPGAPAKDGGRVEDEEGEGSAAAEGAAKKPAEVKSKEKAEREDVRMDKEVKTKSGKKVVSSRRRQKARGGAYAGASGASRDKRIGVLLERRAPANRVLVASKLVYRAQMLMDRSQGRDLKLLIQAAHLLAQAVTVEPNLVSARTMLKRLNHTLAQRHKELRGK